MIVALVSHPRSGSSYINRLLGSFDKVATVMEPFHPDPAIVEQHVKQCVGERFEALVTASESKGFSSLGEWAHHSPDSFIQQIKAIRQAPVLSFKFFPRHLSPEKTGELMRVVDVCIFLSRNLVHSYISSLIANQTGKWANIDTSKQLPVVTEESFLWWNKHLVQFFQEIVELAAACQIGRIDLDYEALLEPQKGRQLISYKLAAQGVDLGEPLSDLRIGSKKQDTRSLALDKVANPELLKCLMIKYGLSRLNHEKQPNGTIKLWRAAKWNLVKAIFQRRWLRVTP